MSDLLFPPDLVPSTMMFGVDDFTAVDESATTGGMQSSALYGTRRWHLRMDFAVLSRANGSLQRFEAFIASMRGRANRVWINPSVQKLRGSFPASELLVNNQWQNAAVGTSWGIYTAGAALSVTDRVGRVSITDPSTQFLGIYQTPTVANYLPTVSRCLVNIDKCILAGQVFFLQNRENSTNVASAADVTVNGMLIAAAAGYTDHFFLAYGQALAAGQWQAGDFYSLPWTSYSRCALVDAQPNELLFSDDFSNAAWTKTGTTITANSGTAPDLSTTADAMTVTATAGVHQVNQPSADANSPHDLTLSCCLRAGTQSWGWLNISDGSSNDFTQWFNLATGALGSTIQTTGTGFTNGRATITPLGVSGWYRCTLTVRRTAAVTVTTLHAGIGASNADAVISFTPSAGNALIMWRAGFAASSVPFLPQQTASTVANAGVSSGSILPLKGLPPSTQGLLLAGDMVEVQLPVNSQLLRVTNRLDSDAGGLGMLQFENTLKQSAGDNYPVIVQQPMGRFVLSGSTLGVEYTPGIFGQASLEFIEAA